MNKLSLWVQRHKILSTVLGLIFVSYLWYDMPFKATDPASSYFVESLFRMRDYQCGSGVEELKDKVLPVLFPVGTEKKYVDSVLVNTGGASIDDQTKGYAEGAYFYRYLPLCLLFTPDEYIIRVYYDKNETVENIHFAGETVVGNKDFKPKLIPTGLRKRKDL